MSSRPAVAGNEPSWLPREGHETAAGGVAPPPAGGRKQALQILSRRDQQPLDVRVQQSPAWVVLRSVLGPVMGVTEPARATSPGFVTQVGMTVMPTGDM